MKQQLNMLGSTAMDYPAEKEIALTPLQFNTDSISTIGALTGFVGEHLPNAAHAITSWNWLNSKNG